MTAYWHGYDPVPRVGRLRRWRGQFIVSILPIISDGAAMVTVSQRKPANKQGNSWTARQACLRWC